MLYWKYIKEHIPVQRVLVLGCDDETGWGETAASVKAANYVGLDVVAKEFFPRKQTDFYPLLTRWLKYEPDLIEFSGCTTKNLEACISQARELGYKGHFSGMLGYSGDYLIKAIGAKAMEGFTYIVAQYHVYWGDISPERKAFLDGAIRKFGDKPDIGLYLDFSHAPFMLAQAIEKAGTLDTNRVAETLRSNAWDTTSDGFGVNVPYGKPVPYGINNALPNPTVILQIRNGKVTVAKEFKSEEVGNLSSEYWSKVGKP
jgi:branched-chain amino acid transport system substrate-binding protein